MPMIFDIKKNHVYDQGHYACPIILDVSRCRIMRLILAALSMQVCIIIIIFYVMLPCLPTPHHHACRIVMHMLMSPHCSATVHTQATYVCSHHHFPTSPSYHFVASSMPYDHICHNIMSAMSSCSFQLIISMPRHRVCRIIILCHVRCHSCMLCHHHDIVHVYVSSRHIILQCYCFIIIMSLHMFSCHQHVTPSR